MWGCSISYIQTLHPSHLSSSSSSSSSSSTSKPDYYYNKPKSFRLPNSCNFSLPIVANTGKLSRIIRAAAASDDTETAKLGSGTTARGRRLLKVREEKRRRETEDIYPDWARVLEKGAEEDPELKETLGDSIGNPELMMKRYLESADRKDQKFRKSATGSIVPFKVSFRDFDPSGSYIWFQLLSSPSDQEVDKLGSVIQAWYVMGRLGAFNSANLQLAHSTMEYDPLYDEEKGSRALPSSFHDISDVEFQDNWGRVWVDLGTTDYLAIDILLNCLTTLNSQYVGIQQLVFGGRKLGDWEEGMTDPKDGYMCFKV